MNYYHIHRRRKGIRIGGGHNFIFHRAHARMGTQLAHATIFVDVYIQVRALIRCSMLLEGSFDINICSLLPILGK